MMLSGRHALVGHRVLIAPKRGIVVTCSNLNGTKEPSYDAIALWFY